MIFVPKLFYLGTFLFKGECMKNLTSQEIRNMWLNFFHEKGHMIEPGASLIPQDDPSLLWINAGVAALKKYFDGSKIPPSKRIVNVQKCIRTNDISNVGKTARHHTFFEMLGNFSIGDYFRKEVVAWAYEILTDEKYFALDKEKLYVTYHPDDIETRDLWIKAGLDDSHLIPLYGNYWQIGEGPCGPNTEVFFDRGEKYDPNKLGLRLLKEDLDNDRYIEIWGIVFSQFNAVNGVERKDYKELPHKNIDTGAGLERIACILQETETNFETDLFYPIIANLIELANVSYTPINYMPFRVIADHIRTCTFALADGENFSNEGRGYVLRRLLRRAMRYGQKLGLYEPFMYKLVDSVVDLMKGFYPYLVSKKEYVKKVIENEEKKFIKTLVSGEKLLLKAIKGKTFLDKESAFKLYDSYGFPIELTIEICSDNNVSVDYDGFKELLEKQRELARNSRKNVESFKKQSKDLLEFNLPSTYTYSDEKIVSSVIGIFEDGISKVSIEDEGEIVLDVTNFYAEMGGQVSDTGIIQNETILANVTYVGKCPNGQHLHKVKVIYGEIKLNDKFELIVDQIKHHAIELNHSATHLLQSALIKVLGDDVKQKGSYVDQNLLRFDFSYNTKVSEENITKVERLVNDFIKESIKSETKVLPLEEAKKIGAIAEFNEKYGDNVRIVIFGEVSKEFCGGTHVKNTNELGIFTIASESAIASGVRRIVAYTGYNAYNYLKEKDIILNSLKSELDAKSINEIISRVTSLKNEINLEKMQNNNLAKKLAIIESKKIIEDLKNNTNNVFYLKGTTKNSLRTIFDLIKSAVDSYKIVLIGEENGKHPLIIGVSEDNLNYTKANELIKKVTEILGGSGGGKPDLAQGNVLDISKIDKLKGII